MTSLDSCYVLFTADLAAWAGWTPIFQDIPLLKNLYLWALFFVFLLVFILGFCFLFRNWLFSTAAFENRLAEFKWQQQRNKKEENQVEEKLLGLLSWLSNFFAKKIKAKNSMTKMKLASILGWVAWCFKKKINDTSIKRKLYWADIVSAYSKINLPQNGYMVKKNIVNFVLTSRDQFLLLVRYTPPW